MATTTEAPPKQVRLQEKVYYNEVLRLFDVLLLQRLQQH
jgi:hypothetical protein